jgi:hypothetical protein
LLDVADVACFETEAGDNVALGGCAEAEDVLGCCVCILVFTTSSGVVITPAIPPALAAVRISSGNPMLFEPM